MQQNPDNKQEVLPEVLRHKSKKKRGKTSCLAKRNAYFGCNICGSENVVFEGVSCCNYCWTEEFFISHDYYIFMLNMSVKPNCECLEKRKLTEKRIFFHPSIFGITSCVDCGAHKGPLCPNCKSPGWYKFDKGINKFTCPRCKFRNY